MGLLITKKDFPSSFPRSLYESVPLAKAEGVGESFDIVAGLSKELAEDLKQHALDESDTELRKGSADYKRFGLNSYEEWFRKERYAFALINNKNHLAGLIWFGPLAPPTDVLPSKENEPWDTAAFRSYEPYRGKGLMADFSKFAFDSYSYYRPERKIWLETNTDNESAKHLFAKLGFTLRGVRNDNGRLVMTK